MENKIKLFEDRRTRYAWDAEREEWFFSEVDVCYVMLLLTLLARTLEHIGGS